MEINKICETIKSKYQFHYDLNNILSNLVYSRIIYPSSKLKTLDLSKKFIEQPNFTYNDLLRSLEIISKEKYTVFQTVDTLRNMTCTKKDNDLIPTYKRTTLTDSLHEAFDFRTDYEILTEKNVKKIIKHNK